MKYEDLDGYEANTLFTETEDFLREGLRYSQKKKEGTVWRIPIADKEGNVFEEIQRSTLASFKAYLTVKKYASHPREDFNVAKIVCASSYFIMILELGDMKPFLSDNGYVGLCPKRSEVGDRIYIPLGAHVPYILRKLDDGGYVLIREAYVHGIMDGEIFEGKENVPSEILRLA
jgi:hypothetical protein